MTIYKFILTGVYSDCIFENSENNSKDSFKLIEYGNDNVPLTEISQENSKKYMTYTNSSQLNSKVWTCMYDYIGKALPIYTDKPCWWCKEAFETSPLGLPIKYICYNKSNKKHNMVKKTLKELNINSEECDYYITEGIFCSFPCMKKYLSNNSKNIKYKECSTLISSLYLSLNTDCKVIPYIPEAGDWKIIDKWGGHLTIQQFRSSFCNFTYNITGNTKRPYMFPSGIQVEEKQVNIYY